MGFFDDAKKNLLGLAKTAANTATSYISEMERQAAEVEKEKQRQAEAESQALQKLEEEKNRILQEIQDEKDKLAEERRRLAEAQSDPSYVEPTSTKDTDLETESVVEDTTDTGDSTLPEDDNSGDLYPGTADDPKTLLDQLADMTAQQNELARRCKEMGFGDEVKSIVGDNVERDPISFTIEDVTSMTIVTDSMTRQVREALNLMLKATKASSEQQKDLLNQAINAIRGAEQAAADVNDLARDIEKKVEEISKKMVATPLSPTGGVRYDWKRKPLFISYGSPTNVYKRLEIIWKKVSPGAKRDENGEPIEMPQYSPFAIATGSTVSSGYEVPEYALVSPVSFENWCRTVGFGDGVSLEIRDMVERPGKKSIL
jgi:hypothetical protein